MADFDRLGKLENWAKTAGLEWGECLVKFKDPHLAIVQAPHEKYLVSIPQMEYMDCLVLVVYGHASQVGDTIKEVEDTLLKRHMVTSTVWWE